MCFLSFFKMNQIDKTNLSTTCYNNSLYYKDSYYTWALKSMFQTNNRICT